MKKELGVYAMENHFRYRVTRSTTTQYEASCTDFNCQWLVCAVKNRQATHCRVIRPVVSIDATHLTGSVKGVLLIASAKDGDSKIYPLAFGFAPSECKGSWTWFLSELKKGIGSLQDLVIISDRHRGIISAMKKVFPDA
ncbi:hypothetical protein LWI29_032717 [Acer saccharum]|uniref:MULE transposase domain-containing protein n=1 Tax=Acer saccharum TaxID=4024 RepID=A0AA39VD20_ACESA|nr:hypothetical protein LWI29_032717 [Acer saccharum]